MHYLACFSVLKQVRMHVQIARLLTGLRSPGSMAGADIDFSNPDGPMASLTTMGPTFCSLVTKS
jgi:hypothetical protein